MRVNNQTELWQQFNLGENNPDPGGGILYAVRYSTEDLNSHQVYVIESLAESGAAITEQDMLLGVTVGELSLEQRQRVMLLLEELSVVNEALEYHTAGLNADSIVELSRKLKAAYYADLTPSGKTRALQLVAVEIPEIIHDIQTAHWQNDVLSPEDLSEVQALQVFANRQMNLLASNNIVIIG